MHSDSLAIYLRREPNASRIPLVSEYRRLVEAELTSLDFKVTVVNHTLPPTWDDKVDFHSVQSPIRGRISFGGFDDQNKFPLGACIDLSIGIEDANDDLPALERARDKLAYFCNFISNLNSSTVPDWDCRDPQQGTNFKEAYSVEIYWNSEGPCLFERLRPEIEKIRNIIVSMAPQGNLGTLPIS